MTPMSGATTRTATATASQVGQPASTRNSLKVNVANIPMAPWAKLKTPDVV